MNNTKRLLQFFIAMSCSLSLISAMAVTSDTSATEQLAGPTQEVQTLEPSSELSADDSIDIADGLTGDPILEEEVDLELQDALIEKPLANDLSPWGMYQAADLVVKSVMIILLAASMITWMLWASKWLQFALVRRQLRQLSGQLLLAGRFVDAQVFCQSVPAVGNQLYAAVAHELALSREQQAQDKSGVKDRVNARLERVLARKSRELSFGTGLLATIGAVSPFIGLFGTVWGIMNAFIGIAETQTTSLAVVAPGIAEALLATAMGLVAAIPAVMIYNHFSRSVSYCRSLFTDVATALVILVSRDFDRQSGSETPTPIEQLAASKSQGEQ